MSVKFKKLAVASAVAGAMGFAGSASAVELGNTGGALLVPHVICDTASQTNTLVGAIVSSLNGPAANAAFGAPGNASPFVSGAARAGAALDSVGGRAPFVIAGERDSRLVMGSPARNAAKATGAGVKRLHWRFYNVNSQHVLDGTMDVTANDFIRFDWCATVASSGLSALNGQPGYLLFHDDNFADARDNAGVQLQGHSYMITGNWASQAFIPVVTVNGPDMSVNPADGYPRIDRLTSGTSFDRADAPDFAVNPVDAADPLSQRARFRGVAMRYFLDPALSTGSDFVFWFNRNARGQQDGGYSRARTPVEVFDSEQVYKFSFNVDLSNELNIIRNTPSNTTIPGMTTGFDGDATNTGLVHFYVPTATLGGAARHSGMAFGFVRLGAGANANQVQTELASEGLWLNGPF
jgi:hypothetical protein